MAAITLDVSENGVIWNGSKLVGFLPKGLGAEDLPALLKARLEGFGVVLDVQLALIKENPALADRLAEGVAALRGETGAAARAPAAQTPASPR